MTRKKMAVGGLPSILKSQRRYWFDDNDGLVEFDVNQEPTSDEDVTETTPQASSTIRRTTPKRSNQNTATKSNNIVTIGTKNFGTAFKQARVAGLDVFRWRGKVYNTKLASEVKNDTKRSSKSNRTKTTSRQTTPRQSRQESNQLNIGSSGIVTVPVYPDNDRSSQTRTAPTTTSNRRQYNARASVSKPVIYDIARAAGNLRNNLPSNNYNMSLTRPVVYDIAREINKRRKK